MREARSLGANTLRVYLEIKAFMKGPTEPEPRTFDALSALLEKAERLRLYLDLTGNLVWRAPPAWYDELPEQARWAVQARFWRDVARTAGSSPAVLVYELTSEPVIGSPRPGTGASSVATPSSNGSSGRPRAATRQSWRDGGSADSAGRFASTTGGISLASACCLSGDRSGAPTSLIS